MCSIANPQFILISVRSSSFLVRLSGLEQRARHAAKAKKVRWWSYNCAGRQHAHTHAHAHTYTHTHCQSVSRLNGNQWKQFLSLSFCWAPPWNWFRNWNFIFDFYSLEGCHICIQQRKAFFCAETNDLGNKLASLNKRLRQQTCTLLSFNSSTTSMASA